MKRIYSLYSLYAAAFVLVLAGGVILLTPPTTVYACGGYATCRDGATILIPDGATDCHCTDNVGQSFAQRLDNVGYDLSKGFNSLTKHDENYALALVEKLQKRDLRTFALIGILTGLDGLLTEQAVLKQ